MSLPAPDGDWSAWLAERCSGALDRAAAQRDRLVVGDGDPLETWNTIGIHLADCLAAAGLLAQVHPDAGIRAEAEEAELAAERFRTALMLDDGVHSALAAVDPERLDPDARRVLAHSLRDLRRAGVDRDEATRSRLREISEQETTLAQAFSRGIREGRRSTQVPAAAVEGLPEDWVAEHPAVGGEVTVTTDYPDTHPFLTFSTDAAARRAVMTAFLDVGWPDNAAVLSELLDLRHEHATLLGHQDWPSFDAEVKMIGSGPAIGDFIDEITAAVGPAGERDLAVLLDRARQDDPAIERIDMASWRHYAELVRRERFSLDAQEVRSYFDFGKVRQGLLDVTGRLFGLTWERVVGAPTWHPDVATYDVAADGTPLGRIHLDLHPRAGKYNHAAQFDLVPGVAGVQAPEGVLVCNFPRGLMTHADVVTLFHEFGHLLHHVLGGRQHWVRFSGVATEWDFVEAPSQMLEEWAWDAEVLGRFATDEHGRPIPADLVRRMRAAEEFGQGYLARAQMFYAAVSYRLHLERPDDLDARVRELWEEYNLIAPLPGGHFFTSFGHLTEYTSGYYTYMWSLVIAKDLFSAFDPADLFAPEVARRYRDTVLRPGGSRDAADLVEEFLGRPYDSAAFRAWLEQGPGA
ncbi:Zn-dependent oligopeptidase [Nocardioides sp. MJB4]|uniref:Zn-dependent oligopeptidase n=1 Tax=Nocardioides donggukensis TaxID=2774019 RepID=A0A927K4S1_9ACTN|nr:Zn-dependent oligopeptidase [Nocardioides donggukensis]